MRTDAKLIGQRVSSFSLYRAYRQCFTPRIFHVQMWSEKFVQQFYSLSIAIRIHINTFILYDLSIHKNVLTKSDGCFYSLRRLIRKCLFVLYQSKYNTSWPRRSTRNLITYTSYVGTIEKTCFTVSKQLIGRVFRKRDKI